MVLASCARLPLAPACGYGADTACNVSILDLIVHPNRYEGRHVRFMAPLWLEAESSKGFAAVHADALTLLDAPNMVAVNLEGGSCDIDTQPMIIEGRFSRAEDYNYRGNILEATVLDPVSQSDPCIR